MNMLLASIMRKPAPEQSQPATAQTADYTAPPAPGPVAQLVHYVRSGYWPWPQWWRAGPGAWLMRDIEDNPRDWTPLLALCCRDPACLWRLRMTFDIPAQIALIRAAPAQWAPGAVFDFMRWQAWRDDLDKAVQPARSRTGTGPQLPRGEHVARPAGRGQDHPQMVANAGLLLLAPMLPKLLVRLSLLQGRQFVDSRRQVRAICLLDWLMWEDVGLEGTSAPSADDGLEAEWRMPLTKQLCGWPPGRSLPAWYRPTIDERETLRTWLITSLAVWPGLREMGPAWARELLLRREGCWQYGGQGAQPLLMIEQHDCDMRLQGTPWRLSSVGLPWLAATLHVQWQGQTIAGQV